ncbi:protein PAT1 homolog 1-like isoform X2 [Olea europaea var. sylvestris]|uniref:protein PAT1 homolog 1-like isoform X2 n=1 Tax=Olea europaea var. sylvestris TaxID=158386 RepID=UPI000C1D692A|nr:protein PAT1 homolog 1-like isoform X2 [Olea europaea var. sylvestris]
MHIFTGSSAEWAQESDFPRWFDQSAFDAESARDSKGLSSQLYSSPAQLVESKSLYRASSYPESPQQHSHQNQEQKLRQHYSSERILIPKSPFTSYPPPGGRSQQASPTISSIHPNVPYGPGGYQLPISSLKLSPFDNVQILSNALSNGSQFGANFPQSTQGILVNNQLQNQLLNPSSLHPGDRSSLPHKLLQQQLPHPHGLMPPQPPLQQNRMQHPFQPSYGHLSGLQSQHFNTLHPPSPPMMNNYDMLGLAEFRDQRTKSMVKNRQGFNYPHHGSDFGNQRSDHGWPKFKSKYMSTDEIENILRMQLAATHSNDPYVDDYYYQACLAKKSAGAKLKHHFCPTILKDSSSRAHANDEPHAFLQVDALGRISFSSIHRPRPLLEVDCPNTSGSASAEQQAVEKPLDQEPMLVARVTIEDCICCLLEVDDIDRFLQFNQLQDGGSQLRHRRQVLLEGLASSLQLVDHLGKNGHTVDLAPEDDLVFLRLISLPKGRKLISRYLQLLSPGGELARVVCMTIFRHLRFLFGGLPSDPGASETTVELTRTVSSCVRGMELKALAACLASVVCSAEHPPLRPVGSAAGDGASVLLKSVLERATQLLMDPNASGSCSMTNRMFWQASFDAFFGLLTKHCFNKYDFVMQSFLTQASPAVIGSDAATAISKEMPVELLSASLPHTSEQQKKLLLEFAQRSMPMLGLSSQGGESGGS